MNAHDPSSIRSQSGFTLIELMVAVVIGLVTTLVITQVLAFSEGQKRSTTSGADAQVNGALALFALQRDIQMAGYGFSSSSDLVGCEVHAKFGGADVATGAAPAQFPTSLAPVFIDTTDPDRNKLRILASSKGSYAVPTRITPPGYDTTNASKKWVFPVSSALGIAKGDLVVAGNGGTFKCEVFRVSKDATPGTVDRTDDGGWNPIGFPTAAYGGSDDDALINLGTLFDHTFSVSANNALQESHFVLDVVSGAPSYSAPRDLFSNIVAMRAFYGKDTNKDNVVDAYDQVAPVTNADWQQVLVVRIAVVARSTQYEKEEVTAVNPQWDVGTATAVSPAPTACGASKCIALHVDGPADWKHYRYKIFDTTIPLRNLLWTREP